MGIPAYAPPVAYKTALIDISESTTISSVVDLEGYKVAALEFGTMTGTTMTFLASSTMDGTYVALMDDAGAAISIVIASDEVIAITDAVNAMALAAVRFIKLVSGSAEVGEDRTIGVILKQ
jgi:hypothetical protein